MQKIGLQAILEDKQFQEAIRRYMESLGQAEKETTTSAGGMNASLGGMVKVAGAGLTALGVTLAATAAGIAALASSAKTIAPVEQAFERFGGSIEEMREATHGMVADVDLMKSYNLAMQLVGDTLGKRLPEAMGYLTKVSGATGQSMDYLLDSLVRGIGRVSPMILDNLGIQVNLSEAYQRYAEQTGKVAESLTKQEQQTALLNVVMEKLRENTAQIGDVTGTAMQGFAGFQATMTNLKNEIGTALWPAVQPVLTGFTKLAQQVMPALSEGAKRIGEALGGLGREGMEGLVGFAETAILKLADLTEGFVVVIDKVSGFIGYLRDMDPVARAVGGSLLAIATVLPFLSLAIGGVTTAVGAATGAFATLTTFLMANPIFLAAAAIAGVGITIAKVVDSNKKKHAEMVETVSQTSDTMAEKMLAAGASYEEYLRAVGEVVIETNELPAATDKVGAGLLAVDAGLALSAEQYANLQQTVQSATGAMSGSADVLRALRQAEDSVGQGAAQGAGDVETLANAFEGMEASTRIAIEASNQAGEALVEAFQTKEVQSALERIQDVIAKHHQDVEKAEATFQQQEQRMLEDAGLQRLQSEQLFQREHAALLAAGRVEDAAELQAKHTEEQNMTTYNADVQRQLRERQYLDQQIQAAEAYQAELSIQRDALLQSLALQIEKMHEDGKINDFAAWYALQTISQMGSEQLRIELQTRQASLDLAEKWAQGTVSAYEFVAGSMATLQKAEEDAAAAAEELRRKREAFKITLPELPPLKLPAISPTGAAAAARSAEQASREATEPATKTLAQVADDIERAVEAAQNALQELTQVEVPEGAREGLRKIAEFLRDATEEFYAIIEPLGERVTKVSNWLKPLNEMMELVTSTAEVMGLEITPADVGAIQAWRATAEMWLQEILGFLEAASTWGDEATFKKAAELSEQVQQLFSLLDVALEVQPVDPTAFAENAKLYVAQLREVAGYLFHWMQEIIENELAPAVKEAAKVAPLVSELFGLVGPDMAEIVPAGEGFSDKAKGYIAQLRETAGYLFHWMQEIITRDLAKAVTEAAKVAEPVAQLFGLIGVDLAEMVPSAPQGFRDRAWNYVSQLRELGGYLFHWMQEIISRGFAPGVVAAAEISSTVSTLFGLIGPDLAELVPVSENFTQKAKGYVLQLRELAGYLFHWMQEIINREFADAVKEAAKIAEPVTKLFDLIGPDLAELVPIGVGNFSDRAQRYVAQLREIGGYLYHWMREIVDRGFGPSLEAAGEVADKVKKLFDILGIELEGIVPPSSGFKRAMQGFLTSIGEGVPIIIKELQRITAAYGDELLDAVGATVERLKKVFGIFDLVKLFEDIQTIPAPPKGARRRTFLSAITCLVREVAIGLDFIMPALQEIQTRWGSAWDEASAIVGQVRELFSTLNEITQAMEGIQVSPALPTGAQRRTFSLVIGKLVNDITIGLKTIMPALQMIQAHWGSDFDKASATMDQVGQLFNSLNESAQTMEAIQTRNPLNATGKRTFISAIGGLINNMTAGLELIMPALREIQAHWGSVLDEVSAVVEQIRLLFSALGIAAQTMEEIQLTHPLNIAGLNTLLGQMAEVIRLAGGLVVTPLIDMGTEALPGAGGATPLTTAITAGMAQGTEMLRDKIVESIQSAFAGTEILVVFKTPGRGDAVAEVTVGQQQLVRLGAVA